MLDKDTFMRDFGIEPEMFSKSRLTWDELENIGKNYESRKPSLETIGRAVVEVFQSCDSIHSMRFRVKDTGKLLEKILRKSSDDRPINLNNYLEEITDLIGVRVIHLFKEDWLLIDTFIAAQWSLRESRIAYIRKGDDYSIFEIMGCTIKDHPNHYRSVHYIIESSLTKSKQIVEVQVRTLFEEGWSEIDHLYRYKGDCRSEVDLTLNIINTVSGLANELTSYVRDLDRALKRIDAEYTEEVESLKAQIHQLQVSEEDKIQLYNKIDLVEGLKLQMKSLDALKGIGSNLIGPQLQSNAFKSFQSLQESLQSPAMLSVLERTRNLSETINHSLTGSMGNKEEE